MSNILRFLNLSALCCIAVLLYYVYLNTLPTPSEVAIERDYERAVASISIGQDQNDVSQKPSFKAIFDRLSTR